MVELRLIGAAPEPDTWDVKVGRTIRRFFGALLWGPLASGRGYESPIDAWERAKMEAWDREEQEGRQRSSEELHEELRRLGDNQRKSGE